MSDEPAHSPEPPVKPPTKSAARVRRISNPRPKKVAKTAKAKTKPEEADASPVKDAATPEATPVETPAPAAANPQLPTETATTQDREESPTMEGPTEQTSSGETPSQNTGKRKRRRRKGKGPHGEESPGDDEERGDDANEGSTGTQQRQNQRPRPKVDPELLSKRAWKIFLAEVSEEGVALVGDNDARELSRRCFRLAEIFLEEQGRRR
jgi:hypothetical protein